MTKHGEHRRAEQGFTLVEVMVSLLIFGMLAAAGVAILTFSVRAQETTGAKFDDIAALNRTMSLMSADLGQATLRAARDESGTRRPAFTGEGDARIAFVRAGWSNIDASPRTSLQKVQYRVANGALERLAYPAIDGAAPMPPMALLTGVERVSARYRYRGAWSNRWDGTQGAPLPQAVELSIVRKNGDGYRAMMLVGTGYAPQQLGAPGAAGG
jgi:general secretion pathway protein J